MAGTEVFARRASGLTREASLLDAAYFGIMNNGVPVSVWLVLGAFAWVPGANLTIASLIMMVLTVFGLAFVFGILGGSMPRSGGEYVYNSRILHPVVGMGESFCTGALVQLAWIWILAPWIGETGLPMMAAVLGIPPEAVEPFTHGWGLYLVSTLANVTGLLAVMAGMKTYFKIQRVFVTWALVGVVIPAVIFAATSHEQFVAIWNSYAEQYRSLDFASFVQAAQQQMDGIPETWNWRSTLGMLLPISWVSIYAYIIAFIGGEVKSPRKNLFIAQVLNAIVPISLLLFIGLAYTKTMGWEGVHALAWAGENDLEGYTFPFKPTYVALATMIAGHSKILGFIMAAAFIVADWLWVPCSYICWSRAAFAWGMDGLGPRWFTEISPRWNQPVKLLVAMFIASQIALTQYCWNPEFLGGFSVEVLELISVFGITAVAAIVFPYVGKVRHIWRSSPYYNWRIGPIRLVTISGVLLLTMVVLLVVSYYVTEALAFMHEVWTWVFIGVWLSGVGWYYLWKYVRKREGVDVTLTFTQIPPE
ncbi:MAG: amino acid permease [Bacillota bacterium]